MTRHSTWIALASTDESVFFGCSPENVASTRLIQSTGARLIGNELLIAPRTEHPAER